MSMDRRRFLTRYAAAISLGGVAASASARDQRRSAEPVKSHKSSGRSGNRIAFSIHQGFLSPDPAERQRNVDHTIHCIELAYQMGIPTMRVNTGTWKTSKDFDELMKNRGIEPPIKGYTDEDGFKWVIDSF